MQECCICKTNVTPNMVETEHGRIAVCHECLDQTKNYFIFICVACGTVHKRNKEEAMKRWEDDGPDNLVVRGLKLLLDQQVVIGISGCIDCPDEIEEVAGNA